MTEDPENKVIEMTVNFEEEDTVEITKDTDIATSKVVVTKEMATANPELTEGDTLIVPETQNTSNVQGELTSQQIAHIFLEGALDRSYFIADKIHYALNSAAEVARANIEAMSQGSKFVRSDLTTALDAVDKLSVAFNNTLGSRNLLAQQTIAFNEAILEQQTAEENETKTTKEK